MITLTVTDAYNHPVDNADVSIFWTTGSPSSGRTDSAGQVKFKILGTIESITANGTTVLSGPVYFDRDVNKTVSI